MINIATSYLVINKLIDSLFNNILTILGSNPLVEELKPGSIIKYLRVTQNINNNGVIEITEYYNARVNQISDEYLTITKIEYGIGTYMVDEKSDIDVNTKYIQLTMLYNQFINSEDKLPVVSKMKTNSGFTMTRSPWSLIPSRLYAIKICDIERLKL